MNFPFLYMWGFTGPQEPSITTGICTSVSDHICCYLPASFKASSRFRRHIYREQHHLHSISLTPKPPPTLPMQLSAPARAAVAKNTSEPWHDAPVTAIPAASPVAWGMSPCLPDHPLTMIPPPAPGLGA